MHHTINGILDMLKYGQNLWRHLAALVWEEGRGGPWIPCRARARVGGAGTILGPLVLEAPLCARGTWLWLSSLWILFPTIPSLWLLRGTNRVQDKCRLHEGDEESSEYNKEKERESSPGLFQGNSVKCLEWGCRQLALLREQPRLRGQTPEGEEERGRIY